MDKIDINLHNILRSRIKGWKGRMIPGFMITGLEKLVHQDELNAALDATYPSTGSEFCERQSQCVTVEVYRRIDEAIDQVVDNITLKDLVALQHEKWKNPESAL